MYGIGGSIWKTTFIYLGRIGLHITWSKCVRTRRCQSLRKSTGSISIQGFSYISSDKLTVVLDLLVVFDRLSPSADVQDISIVSGKASVSRKCPVQEERQHTMVVDGDQMMLKT